MPNLGSIMVFNGTDDINSEFTKFRIVCTPLSCLVERQQRERRGEFESHRLSAMKRGWQHQALVLLAVVYLAECQDLEIQCPQAVIILADPPAERVRSWTHLYGRCYLHIPGRTLPWIQALGLCEKYGAKLAEPVGFVLTDEIGDLVTNSDPSVTSVWTGYTRVGYTPATDDTGAFWSDGGSATVDVGVWGHQEPRIYMGNCAYMRLDSDGWRWYLDVCDRPRPFVCEAIPCPKESFRCDSGRCVASNLRCNGENNCGDDSDERNCPNDCSVYITDLRQDLVYPGANVASYSNLDTCVWVVEGSAGGRVYLEIIQLNTEKGVDFLEIWGGGRTLSTSVLLRRVSGTVQDALAEAPLVVSPNNMAIVRFASDASVTDSGFRIRWRSEFECDLIKARHLSAVPGDGNPTTTSAASETGCYNQCLLSTSCVAATYSTSSGTCSNLREMPEVTAAVAGQVLYVKTCPGLRDNTVLSDLPVVTSPLYASSTPSRLFSPLYPVFYPGGQSYMWTIIASGQNLITVEILDVELGPHDYLRFYDGSNLRSEVIATLTSTDPASGRVITSSKNRLLVYLRSENFANVRGFLLSYREGCDYIMSGSSGTLQSPGYDLGIYPNAMECTWSISTDQGRALRLNFDSFSLELDKDFLQVYKDVSGSPVHSGSGYSGSVLPSIVDSTDGRLRLVMTTSAVGTRTGFKATYNAGCLPISDSSISMTPSGTVFRGDKVTVTCRSNYVFVSPYSGQGSVVLTCGSGGDWDREVPTCTQVLCGNVPTVSNGYLQSVSGVFSGDTATYVCDTGFRLYPDNTPSTCTNTGQWQPYPFCLAETQCRPLLAPTNGKLDVVLGNGRDTGTVVQFLCTLAGYELVGTPIISCVGGAWTASEPTCERIKCGLPYISNATLSPSSNVGQGDIITVTCKPGFQLIGSSQFQCGVTTSLPSCTNIDECSNFQSRCSQVCTDRPGGYTCSCREGYTLNIDGFTCSDINECNINNGDCDDTCTNTQGSYVCSCPSSSAELFTRSGQFGVVIPSTENGDQPWNLYHLNHTCVQPPDIECPELSRTIPNGRLLSDQATYGAGDVVTYLCNLGYEMVGPATITCQSSGEWNNNPPQCIDATCPPPSTVTTVVSPSSEIGYLEYFTGTCNVQGLGEVQLRSRCTYNIQAQSYQASISDLQCPLGRFTDIADVACPLGRFTDIVDIACPLGRFTDIVDIACPLGRMTDIVDIACPLGRFTDIVDIACPLGRFTDIVDIACPLGRFTDIVDIACPLGRMTDVVDIACPLGRFTDIVDIACPLGRFTDIADVACPLGRFMDIVDIACPLGRFMDIVDIACPLGRFTDVVDVACPLGRMTDVVDIACPLGRMTDVVDVACPLGRMTDVVDIACPLGRFTYIADVACPLGRMTDVVDIACPLGRMTDVVDIACPLGRFTDIVDIACPLGRMTDVVDIACPLGRMTDVVDVACPLGRMTDVVDVACPLGRMTDVVDVACPLGRFTDIVDIACPLGRFTDIVDIACPLGRFTDVVDIACPLGRMTDVVDIACPLGRMTDVVDIACPLGRMTDVVDIACPLGRFTDVVDVACPLGRMTDVVDVACPLGRMTDVVDVACPLGRMTDVVDVACPLGRMTDIACH
ncbi:hypothetical protein RRG08_019384 [Elysia crispata]|uniref:Uncharacterized protein n=1 Tax=Elysia crispata TaxID=231223 RepID=A0AAE1CM53_9GAST|nr:hypothetical protein RRG08_019384 [Elysia crispata]